MRGFWMQPWGHAQGVQSDSHGRSCGRKQGSFCFVCAGTFALRARARHGRRGGRARCLTRTPMLTASRSTSSSMQILGLVRVNDARPLPPSLPPIPLPLSVLQDVRQKGPSLWSAQNYFSRGMKGYKGSAHTANHSLTYHCDLKLTPHRFVCFVAAEPSGK